MEENNGTNVRIYVDADACPVVGIVERLAKKYGIPVTLLCDTNHVLESSYSEVKVTGAGADAVDYALIGLCKRGDIVVTQDYGVAAMALGKGAYAIHQSGKWYTEENIDRMLMERHLAKKARLVAINADRILRFQIADLDIESTSPYQHCDEVLYSTVDAFLPTHTSGQGLE